MVGDRKVYPVAQFNAGVASWLGKLPRVWVEGEITELRSQPGWQTVFVTLTDVDDGTTLSVTMPRSAYESLTNPIREGMRVQAFGRPDLYEARGTFQLRAVMIEPVGVGDLLVQLEALRAKLAAEGLFDAERKRRLPALPRRIGVLTGSEAAAKRDIVSTATTRFPGVRLVVFETTVQGPRAPLAISGGLQTLAAQADLDVIILARGGGSFEDLLPFSDERVIRAVADSPVPVVSAVGHEHDHPICDLAADARAATPTAAAAMVVPDAAALLADLDDARRELRRCAQAAIERLRKQLRADRRLLLRAPLTGLVAARARLVALRSASESELRRSLTRRAAALEAITGRLRALSPHATLERGYALVRHRDGVVTDASTVSVGAQINVTLSRGALVAGVESVEEAE